MKKSSLVLYVIAAICILTLGVARVILAAWMPFMWILVGGAILAIGFAIGSDFKTYQDFFAMKTTKKGFNMGSIVVMTLALLIAVNYLGAKKYKTFDFSTAKLNSLSEQSAQVVRALKDDVKVIYFYQEGSEGVEENKQAFTNLLRKYQDLSSALKLEFVEMNARPDLTEKYQVTQAGVVFVEMNQRTAKIEKIDEQELTSAIVKVSREKDKKIYFVTGHGERELGDEGTGRGLGALKKLLEGSRYIVESVNLVTTPKIPEDADVVAIVGPIQEFLESEVKTLNGYLAGGGSLLLATETSSGTGLDSFLKSLGVTLGSDNIVLTADTPLGKMVDPRQTVVDSFPGGQSITKPFPKGQAVLMRIPRPIIKSAEVPSGVTVSDLLLTNINMVGFSSTEFKTAKQTQGPFLVGAKIERKFEEKTSTIVLFSDADFLSNELLYQSLNRDLALNSFSSLAKEENLVSIAPKEITATKIDLPEVQVQQKLTGMQMLIYLPMPFAFFFIALYLFFKRRYA